MTVPSSNLYSCYHRIGEAKSQTVSVCDAWLDPRSRFAVYAGNATGRFMLHCAITRTWLRPSLPWIAFWIVSQFVYPQPAAAQLNVQLVRFSESNHPSLGNLDEEFMSHPNNPAEEFSDPNGAMLQPMLQHAAEQWEAIFAPNNHTIEITWFWDNDLQQIDSMGNQPTTTAIASGLVDEDGDGRVDFAIIRFNPNRTGWWFDPTPNDDSEFNMSQQLYRDIAASTSPDPAWRFPVGGAGQPPNLFETAYFGAAPPNSVANNMRDAVTVAMHEMGHALGMGGNHQPLIDEVNASRNPDLDFDLDPDKVGGSQVAAYARGNPANTDPNEATAGLTAHLAGSQALMGRNPDDRRKRPSAVDILALSLISGLDAVVLPRTDFLVGNTWEVAGNWEGDRVPGTTVDASIRHGGLVSLSENDTVSNLVVDEGSLLAINNQSTLSVLESVRVGGLPGTVTILSVNTNGELDADLATIAEDGRINLSDSTSLLQVENLVIADGGELRGEGIVDINNEFGMLTSDGVIRATSGELRVTSSNDLALALRGEIFAVNGDIRFQAGMAEPITAEVTIDDTRTVVFQSVAAVGDGGRINLTGSSFFPAVVSGSLLFLNDGAVIHASGAGNVQNSLILNPGSVVDTEPASAINLIGSTTFQGGQVAGGGIVRQNGNATVFADTLISVDTYDLDGAAESTVITINLGATLDIDSLHIDTGPNLFHGTIHNNGGMLDVETGWSLVGDLNLTQTGGAGAALLGAGGVTILGAGQLNVSGFAGIATSTTIAGEVFVAGEANFNGTNSILSTADLETNGASDEIDFNGPVTLAGGSYTGSGVIKFNNQVIVTANTTIGMSQTDLDGDTALTVIDVRPNVTFSIASSTIDPTDNAFDGEMNIEGTFSTIVPFLLDGVINMTRSADDPPPVLTGLTGFTISNSGMLLAVGNAIIDRDTTVQGILNVNSGLTQINGTASFESSAVVTVAVGSELELNGVTTFSGGSYTRGGLMQLNGTTTVEANTTISIGRIDLDGAGENTTINVNDAQFALNVDSVDATTNSFNGVLNVSGGTAQLAVNLSNPPAAWRLASGGILNFTNPSAVATPATMLTGAGLSVEGIINGTGRVALAVNMSVQNRLNTVTSTSDVHFAGDDRTTVHQNLMATIAGLGSITIDNGTTVNLENQSLVAVDTENVGRLEVGFTASEVSIDYTVPATATIRGAFSQATSGEFAIDLGGLKQSTQYDLLEVIGTARLNGTIEVTLIDGFVPSIGNTFQVLTATQVNGEFNFVETIDADDLFGFVLNDIYSPIDVRLRVADVFLIGDYDDDDDVDGADFLEWQKNLGAPAGTIPNDIDGGPIGQAQYETWQSHFGNTMPSPVSLNNATVPEPASAVPLAFLLATVSLKRLRRTWRAAGTDSREQCADNRPFSGTKAPSLVFWQNH